MYLLSLIIILKVQRAPATTRHVPAATLLGGVAHSNGYFTRGRDTFQLLHLLGPGREECCDVIAQLDAVAEFSLDPLQQSRPVFALLHYTVLYSSHHYQHQGGYFYLAAGDTITIIIRGCTTVIMYQIN